MKKFSAFALIAAFAMPLSAGVPARATHAASPVGAQAAVPSTESDQTLHAMHDEMERARTRLQLPGVDKPFYFEYRLMDVDVRAVTASFLSLIHILCTHSQRDLYRGGSGGSQLRGSDDRSVFAIQGAAEDHRSCRNGTRGNGTSKRHGCGQRHRSSSRDRSSRSHSERSGRARLRATAHNTRGDAKHCNQRSRAHETIQAFAVPELPGITERP